MPGCTRARGAEPREPSQKAPPSSSTPTSRTRRVVETNCGEFTIALDPRIAERRGLVRALLPTTATSTTPSSTGSFRSFVIQGGDPTATGTGGPATRPSTRPPRTRSTRSGSRDGEDGGRAAAALRQPFFVVTSDEPSSRADYAVIGEVTAGLESSPDRTARRPARSTDHPVVIESIEISSRRLMVAARSSWRRVPRAGSARRSSACCCRSCWSACARAVSTSRRRRRRTRARDGRPRRRLRRVGARARASLRCGLEALGPTSRQPSSCSPTGRPRARRRSTAWSRPGGRPAPRSWPRATAATAAIPSCSPAPAWNRVPDEGARALEPLLVPCDDLGLRRRRLADDWEEDAR